MREKVLVQANGDSTKGELVEFISGLGGVAAIILTEKGEYKSFILSPDVKIFNNKFKNESAAMPVGKSLKRFMAEQEDSYIESTIEFHDGDKNEASRTLKISTATMYRKIKENRKLLNS